jgi:hypothetical protein
MGNFFGSQAMIIWGSRALTSTQATGSFACPECKVQIGYEKKQMRRFFTLYFIPLFPTETLGQWIECTRCHTNYKEAVLQYRLPPTPTERMRLLAKAIAGVGGLAARLNGGASEQRLAGFTAALREFSDLDVPSDWLRTPGAAPEPAAARSALAERAEGLTDAAKEEIFAMIHRVVASPSPLSAAAAAFLEGVGEGLGLTGVHVKGLLVTLQGQASHAV